MNGALFVWYREFVLPDTQPWNDHSAEGHKQKRLQSEQKKIQDFYQLSVSIIVVHMWIISSFKWSDYVYLGFSIAIAMNVDRDSAEMHKHLHVGVGCFHTVILLFNTTDVTDAHLGVCTSLTHGSISCRNLILKPSNFKQTYCIFLNNIFVKQRYFIMLT